jgi:hypothetical protein
MKTAEAWTDIIEEKVMKPNRHARRAAAARTRAKHNNFYEQRRDCWRLRISLA